jgi:hypothetical protein
LEFALGKETLTVNVLLTSVVSFDDLLGSEYESSYSFFGSPTDDWPTMSTDTMEEANKAVRPNMRRGPLKTIRRVAGRFKDIIIAQ